MIVLAIDTSSDQFGVALVSDTQVLASYEVLAQRPHAVELPQAVSRVLQAGRTSLSQIDGIALDIGPGSFTGLRVGVAFVKALVFQSRRPVVGIASLDVLASQMPCATARMCPILDAKQRKVYTASYEMVDGQLTKRTQPTLVVFEAWLPALDQQPTMFLGDGVALYRERLRERLGAAAIFAAPEFWLPRAATLGRLGLARLAAGSIDDPSTLVPLYLYPMDCTVRSAIPLSGSPTISASRGPF